MVRKAAILTGVGQVRVTVAVLGVIHDHPRGLHERVANGRPDERETGFFQGTAHGFGLWRDSRDLAAIRKVIDLGHAADKRPEQAHRVFQRQPGRGIAAGSIELQTIAYDTRVEHQCFNFSIGQLG